jgi:hypothetical protein
MSPGTPVDEEMVEFLERDQLVGDTSRPVARLNLTPGMRASFWLLRVVFSLLSVMVVWTFVAGLGN